MLMRVPTCRLQGYPADAPLLEALQGVEPTAEGVSWSVQDLRLRVWPLGFGLDGSGFKVYRTAYVVKSSIASHSQVSLSMGPYPGASTQELLNS